MLRRMRHSLLSRPSLAILTAVLASEPSTAMLTKLFEVWDGVLEVLIRNG